MGQPICKACGQPIAGRFLTALDATWHPEHFLCAACKRPITDARFTPHQGRPYHQDCYAREIAQHCVYCGKPLLGMYRVDYWGNAFCQEHEKAYPACDFCGRLIPSQDQERGAEVVRCRVCQASAIETVEEARPLFKQLIQWVGAQGLRYHQLPLSLELCTKAKLRHYLHENGPTHSLGATMSVSYAQEGRALRSEVSGVAVLQGLPALVFESVVVHELGHVWLVVQGAPRAEAWREEGFCEVLSYRYLRSRDTAESRFRAENMERNPDPIYGEGFRRMQALIERKGFARFIEELEHNKRWQ